MDALLANPFAYVAAVFVLVGLLVGVAIAMERGERRHYERLLASGEAAEATVIGARDTGWRTNGRPHIRFELEVRRPGHPPYRAVTKLTIHRPWSPIPYRPGSVVRVRVAPDDPQHVAIDEGGTAPEGWLGPPAAAGLGGIGAGEGRGAAAPGAPQDGDRPDAEARLRALQRLRQDGLLSDEEYARKRAEILDEL